MQKQLYIANRETIELLDNRLTLKLLLQKAIDTNNPELMAEAIKTVAFAYGLQELAEMATTDFENLCKVTASPSKSSGEEVKRLGDGILEKFKASLAMKDFLS